MDSKILNNRAYQKPFTSNPSTKASQIKMINALMTNKNKPNVTMVTGSVKRIRIGFTNKFNKTRTAATTTAVTKLSTVIPGKILANTTTAIALRTISTRVLTELDCCIMMLSYKKTAEILISQQF